MESKAGGVLANEKAVSVGRRKRLAAGLKGVFFERKLKACQQGAAESNDRRVIE